MPLVRAGPLTAEHLRIAREYFPVPLVRAVPLTAEHLRIAREYFPVL